jgi:hypothetical protein
MTQIKRCVLWTDVEPYPFHMWGLSACLVDASTAHKEELFGTICLGPICNRPEKQAQKEAGKASMRSITARKPKRIDDLFPFRISTSNNARQIEIFNIHT